MTAPFHESTIQVPSGGVFGESQSGASGAIGSNLYGTGTPEGVIAAKIGTVYRDVTPAAAKIYVKTSGTSTTGWEAIGGTSGTSLTVVRQTLAFDTPNIYDNAGIIAFTPNEGDALIAITLSITVANDVVYDSMGPIVYVWLDGDAITDYKAYGGVSDDPGAVTVYDVASDSTQYGIGSDSLSHGSLSVPSGGALLAAVAAGTPIRVGINDNNPTPAQPTTPATAGAGTLTFIIAPAV